MLSKTMVSLSLATVLILASCLYQADAAPAKEKRSLWELNTVISCYTGRSGFDYNGYGCWCGLGGSGAPVDDTDTCCMAHDYCYQSVQDSNCGVYFSSYQYTEQDCSSGSGTIACAGYLTDPNPTTVCHFRLCECDRLLAKCLRRYEDSYNADFAGFEKRFCEARLAQPVVTYHTNTSVTVVGGDETGAYQQVDAVPVQMDPNQHVDAVPEQMGPNQQVDSIPAQRGVLGQLDAMPKQRGVLQQLDAIPQQQRDA